MSTKNIDVNRIEVEVTSRFRHDGVYVQPGDKLVMSNAEADELRALNFVRPTGREVYRNRAMRARGA